MSGGYFDYKQYVLNDISDGLEQELKKINKNESYATKNEDEIDVLLLKSNILHTIELLKTARIHVQRLDWLFSGDDGLETYLDRVDEDLKDLRP